MLVHRNKQVAKNTVFLYIRMMVTLLVTLYTSRIIINTLGFEDFGVYNVIGGLVGFLAIVTKSLSNSCSRFITYELGKDNLIRLKQIFSLSMIIMMILSVILIIIVESLGVWFLNTKMTIPIERLYAANWVLQFSLAVFCLNLLSVPFDACIIAHEKMNVYAYFSILEAGLNLLVAYLINIFYFDSLIIYSFLLFIVAIIMRFIYGFYCARNFQETKFILLFDKRLFKQMLSYAGWTFWGDLSNIMGAQGVNILLNLYFGPLVNAAVGISSRVNAAVDKFVQSFTVALRPQIVKTVAVDDYEYLYQLISTGSRLSFFLLLIIFMPVFYYTKDILFFWLGKYPDISIMFVRLSILNSLIASIFQTFVIAIVANSRIKNYMLIVSFISILINIVGSYYALRNGYPAESVFIMAILVSIISGGIKLYYCRKLYEFPIGDFIRRDFLRILGVTILSFISVYYYSSFNDGRQMCSSLFNLVYKSAIISCMTILSILILGIRMKEYSIIVKQLKSAFNTFK